MFQDCLHYLLSKLLHKMLQKIQQHFQIQIQYPLEFQKSWVIAQYDSPESRNRLEIESDSMSQKESK